MTPGNRDRRRTAGWTAAALLAAALVFVAACGREEGRAPAPGVSTPARAKTPGRPVLRVEKSEYDNAAFRGYIDATGADAAGLPAESLSRLFDRFVDEMILLEAARQKGLTVSEEEKKEYLAKLAVEAISADGSDRTDSAPPQGAFDRLLIDKYTFLVVRDVRADAGEIADYYEQHKKEFLLPGRVQVSQILVDSEEKAVSVLRRLERTGEAEFRRIAREESQGPERSRGGVMGVFQTGDLPADMERVIFALDEGRNSQVVESSYGFHIFRLDRKFPPALQTESEAAPEIVKRIMAQKMKDALAAHLDGLKGALSWQPLTDNLFFAYQRFDE